MREIITASEGQKMNAAEAIEVTIQIEKLIRSPCCDATMEFWHVNGFPAFVVDADRARCVKCGRTFWRQEFDWEFKDAKEKTTSG